MWNEALFATINNYAGKSVWFDRIGVFLAVYLTYLIVMALIYGAFLTGWKYGKRMFWEAISAAVIGRLVVVEAIRYFYHSPRPFAVESVNQLIPGDGSWSFPSGHVTFLVALSTAIWFYNRKLGYFTFALSIVVGIARVYAGVHWPFDIIGGIGIGIVTAVVWHYLFGFYLRRRRTL